MGKARRGGKRGKKKLWCRQGGRRNKGDVVTSQSGRTLPRRGEYTAITQSNAWMEGYYAMQGLHDHRLEKHEDSNEYKIIENSTEEKEAERLRFLNSMRSILPSSFRVSCGDSTFEEEFITELREHISELRSKAPDFQCSKIFRNIPFIPGGYQLGIYKRTIRKHDSLKSFHEWLKIQTSSGVLTRQETVSMIPPRLLSIEPHHAVLDMCAAPGSKTCQILEHLRKTPSEGFVLANDADPKRAFMLVHQLRRMNTAQVAVTSVDARKLRLPEGCMDRVLADVPCSGDGTVRKNPGIWRNWSPLTGLSLHPLQISIALNAARITKIGGYMCYSTCSLNPIENEAVVAEVLRATRGALTLVDKRGDMPELVARPGWRSWSVIGPNRTNKQIKNQLKLKEKWAKKNKEMENKDGEDNTENDTKYGATDNDATDKKNDDKADETAKTANETDSNAPIENNTDMPDAVNDDKDNKATDHDDSNKAGETAKTANDGNAPNDNIPKEETDLNKADETGQNAKEASSTPMETNDKMPENTNENAVVDTSTKPTDTNADADNDPSKEAQNPSTHPNPLIRPPPTDTPLFSTDLNQHLISIGLNLYPTYKDVPKQYRRRIRPSCFPPKEDMDLEKCLRILPQDMDTGGFFVALFRKDGDVGQFIRERSNKLYKEMEEVNRATRRGHRADADVDETAEASSEDIPVVDDVNDNDDDVQIDDRPKVNKNNEKGDADLNDEEEADETAEASPPDPKRLKIDDDNDNDIPVVDDDVPMDDSDDIPKVDDDNNDDIPNDVTMDDEPQQETETKPKPKKPSDVYNGAVIPTSSSTWPALTQFYGLSPSFPKDQIMSRACGEAKILYYISSSIKHRLIDGEWDGGSTSGKKSKYNIVPNLVHTGLKAFERNNQTCEVVYRINQEGIHFIAPHMSSKRKIITSLKDFETCLDTKLIPLTTEKFSEEFVNKVKEMKTGSFVVALKGYEMFPHKKLFLSMWRCRAMQVNCLVGKVEMDTVKSKLRILETINKRKVDCDNSKIN